MQVGKLQILIGYCISEGLHVLTGKFIISYFPSAAKSVNVSVSLSFAIFR